MHDARAGWVEYQNSLTALLTAMERELDPSALQVLSDRTSAAFDSATAHLNGCSAQSRAALAAELGRVQRFVALTRDSASRARAQVVERLGELEHAKVSLREMDQRKLGQACDIAG